MKTTQILRADTRAERACIAEQEGRTLGMWARRTNDFGELYVIQYATGVVKVGRSFKIGGRIKEHRRVARSLGVEILRTWQSRAHCGHSKTETELIRLCRRFSPTQRGSRHGEYFAALDFDLACWIADTVIDMAMADQRSQEDRERRKYLDKLLAAAGGDISTTWATAHQRPASASSRGGVA